VPDYSTHDPKGWCGNPSRGAALGRPTVMDAPKDFSGRLFVSRVRLNSGGYDKNGTYFGHGPPSPVLDRLRRRRDRLHGARELARRGARCCAA
jgi:hypothetical protein